MLPVELAFDLEVVTVDEHVEAGRVLPPDERADFRNFRAPGEALDRFESPTHQRIAGAGDVVTQVRAFVAPVAPDGVDVGAVGEFFATVHADATETDEPTVLLVRQQDVLRDGVFPIQLGRGRVDFARRFEFGRVSGEEGRKRAVPHEFMVFAHVNPHGADDVFDGIDQAIMARLTAWTTDWETWKDEQAQALERERRALQAELASREQELKQRTRDRDKIRKRYIDKPSDATEEALVECRRLVAEAEARVAETKRRLDAYPTEPDTDALLDVQSRFSGIATDPKLTINAKAKMLLKEVRIYTHPNGDVTLQCVGREDVVIPPLQPGTKPGIGEVPPGYHVIPSPEAQRALLTIDSNASASHASRLVHWCKRRRRRDGGSRFRIGRGPSVSADARLARAMREEQQCRGFHGRRPKLPQTIGCGPTRGQSLVWHPIEIRGVGHSFIDRFCGQRRDEARASALLICQRTPGPNSSTTPAGLISSQ